MARVPEYSGDPVARIAESDGWIVARFARLIGQSSAFKAVRVGSRTFGAEN